VALPNNTPVTVATLASLPAGSYVIFAKTTVVQTAPSGGGGTNAFTRCTVNGDPSTNVTTDDYAEAELGRGAASEVGRATLATHVTLSLSSTGSVTLRCRVGDNSGASLAAVARESKLIAIKVDAVTRGVSG
jgi:hypothetical protein